MINYPRIVIPAKAGIQKKGTRSQKPEARIMSDCVANNNICEQSELTILTSDNWILTPESGSQIAASLRNYFIIPAPLSFWDDTKLLLNNDNHPLLGSRND